MTGKTSEGFREWFHGEYCSDFVCLCDTNDWEAHRVTWQAATAIERERCVAVCEAEASEYFKIGYKDERKAIMQVADEISKGE